MIIEQEDFKHAAESAVNMLRIFQNGKALACNADDTGEDDSAGKHHEDVEACQGADQHKQVRDDLDKTEGIVLRLRQRFRAAENQQQDDRGNGGRQRNTEIGPELILHLDTL